MGKTENKRFVCFKYYFVFTLQMLLRVSHFSARSQNMLMLQMSDVNHDFQNLPMNAGQKDKHVSVHYYKIEIVFTNVSMIRINNTTNHNNNDGVTNVFAADMQIAPHNPVASVCGTNPAG